MKIQHPIVPANALRRLAAASFITGHSRSGIYDAISRGLMTKPVKIGARCSALPAREIDTINAATIRGAYDDEVRALVSKLHADRNKAA